MSLDDLIEAHLRGDAVDVPADLRDDFEFARRAQAALDRALGETLLAPDGVPSRTPPQLPADYQIVDEIGRGGMGVVYRARQRSLGREVAVKVLRPGEATFGPLIRRFLDEARHLARLRHPNIVSIHEVGDAGGEPYFTMDYVAGESLAAALARGALPPARALAILEQVADGVAHAHGQGIIHRDLKPANVLLDAGGRVFVTDFGLARDMTQVSDRTQSGQLLGTPAYMAPEQALGQTDRIGEATDVHGLGVLLYEMLTGRPPYGNDAPAKVLARLLHDEPVSPRKIDRRIPRALETVCLKAIARRPEQRYATVRALREDLRRFGAGESVVARPASVWSRGGRWLRRRWQTVAAVAATAVLVAVVVGLQHDDPAAALVARAERYAASGEPTLAVRFYRDAWSAVGEAQRPALLARMQAAVAAIDDPKLALTAAGTVLACAPRASVGRHDYAVAMTSVSRAEEQAGRDVAAPETVAMLELAGVRLRVFLDGEHGSAEERQRAQAALARTEELAQRDWIRDEKGLPVAWMDPDQGDPLTVDQQRLVIDALLGEIMPRIEARESEVGRFSRLPEGDIAELERAAQAANTDRWERGKAAYAAGLAHEKDGNVEAARTWLRRGYDLLRAEFPIYAWDDAFRVTLEAPPGVPPPARGCAELLAQAAAAVQRAEPQTSVALRGGIRVHLIGPALPEGLLLRFVDCLRHPDDVGVHMALPRDYYSVSFEGATTAWLGVVDGVYWPWLGMINKQTANEAAANFADRLLVEAEWPERIEVRGDTVDLEVRLRLVGVIAQQRPADGALVDLENDVFRWSAVAGADAYRVTFGRRITATEGIKDPPLVVRTNALCIGTLADRGAIDWQQYSPGLRVEWSVEAVDANGGIVGQCFEKASFLVSRGLEAR